MESYSTQPAELARNAAVRGTINGQSRPQAPAETPHNLISAMHDMFAGLENNLQRLERINDRISGSLPRQGNAVRTTGDPNKDPRPSCSLIEELCIAKARLESVLRSQNEESERLLRSLGIE